MRAVREAIDDVFGAGVGTSLVHSPNGRFVVTISEPRLAFEITEDELGGAVRGFGARVATDESGELAAHLGFLEFVGERASVVKRTRRPCWRAAIAESGGEVRPAGAPPARPSR